MALIFADGFEDWSSGIPPGWSSSTSGSAAGRFGGTSIEVSNTILNFGTGIRSTFICGFAFWANALSPVFTICSFSGGGGGQCFLRCNTDGSVSGVRGSTVLATSSAGLITATTWIYIEVKVQLHNSTGRFVVRINNATVIDFTGDTIDFGTPTGVDTWQVSGPGPAQPLRFDDIYFADETGSYNNDFLGDLVVEHHRPTADEEADFVGSDGNSTDNWALIDESGNVNTADYVGSATISNRDLYTTSTSSRSASSLVHGVIIAASLSKSDAGSKNGRIVTREGSAGAVRVSSDISLPASFGHSFLIHERKNDSSVYSLADANALRIGVEVAS